MIHPTFILGGDKVGELTIIFKQHTADGEGLAEKQGVPSTVLLGGKQWGRNHVNCRSFSERTTSSSSLRSTRLSLSAVLYSVYTYTTVGPSRCRQLDASPPKSTSKKVSLPDIIREKKCYTRSGPQADKLLRSRPSSHVERPPFNN